MRVDRMNGAVLITEWGDTAGCMEISQLHGLDRSGGISLAMIARPQETMLERSQWLISQWDFLAEFGSFSAYDAARTDGLNTTGYFGAVFDGRYVYFAPEQHASLHTHANILRYDTHGSFYDPGSYAAYDASRTAGLDVRGFYGAAFDGTFVYFIPRQLDMTQYHSRLLRYDTRREFKDPGAWEAHDIGLAQSAQGCAFDGRFLYFCPGFTGDPKKEDQRCGRVIRFDTQGEFHHPSSYRWVDLRDMLGPKAACFDGGAFDGRYVYFVPLYNHLAVRYDTTRPFDSPDAWGQVDLTPLGAELFVGSVFDGKHLYLVPYASSRVLRFNVSQSFDDLTVWEVMDIAGTDGLDAVGFDGGFFDGRFVHFVPFVRGDKQSGYTFHTHFVRYDTTGRFTDRGSWSARDAILTEGMKTTGYNAGAFDGRYFYCAPWQQGREPVTGERVVHGRILRYDTTGDSASFSLRFCDYGHNGGLNAAVRGPAFLVNTTQGPRGVSMPFATGEGILRIAASYDGRRLTLHVNDRQISRDAPGRLLQSASPVQIGSASGQASRFRGSIDAIALAHAGIEASALLAVLDQTLREKARV